jgi:hypothetical protein
VEGHVGAAGLLIDYVDAKKIKNLLSTIRGNDPLAMKAKATLLEVLLNYAQDSQYTTWYRRTLRKLIKAGADKIQDAQGKTALMRTVDMMASGNEQGLKSLKNLLKAGATTKILDNEGKTVKDYGVDLAARQINPNDQALRALKDRKKYAVYGMFQRMA